MNQMASKIKKYSKIALGRYPNRKIDLKEKYIITGSGHASWPIHEYLFRDDVIAYSFGVGDDISWDLSAIEKFGWEIFAFDPTPRSIEWLEQQDLPDSFKFVPVGLGASDRLLEFYPHDNPTYVSYSATRPGRADSTLCIVKHLNSIIDDLQHDKIDILKMDIEGSEYDVLSTLEDWEVLPSHIMVEFHHYYDKYTVHDTNTCIDKLYKHGYRIYYKSDSGYDFAFIRIK